MAQNALQQVMNSVGKGIKSTPKVTPSNQIAFQQIREQVRSLPRLQVQNLARIPQPSLQSYIPSSIKITPPQIQKRFAEWSAPALIKTKTKTPFFASLKKIPEDIASGWKMGWAQTRAGLAATSKNINEEVTKFSKQHPLLFNVASVLPPVAGYRINEKLIESTTGKPVSEHFSSIIRKNMEIVKKEQSKRIDLESRPLKEKLVDPRFYAFGISSIIPNMIGAIGVGAAVTTATGGNPFAGAAAGFAFSASLEGGSAYIEAIERGAAEEEADKVSTIVGSINGVLEVIPLWGYIKNTAAGKIFKTQLSKVVINDLLTDIGKQALKEGTTETLQEIVSNAASRVYDANAPIFNQAVIESGVLGAVSGGLLGGVGDRMPPPGLTVQDVSKLRTQLVRQGLAAEEDGNVALANQIKQRIIEIDQGRGKARFKAPKPQQETVLRVTGEGRISGQEVNRQLDKMWNEKMQETGISATPIAKAIDQSELVEQMGEAPLIEEIKQKEVVGKEPSQTMKEVSAEIPRITPEGFDFPVETPVLRAVTTLYPNEKTISSGFHTAWKEPVWAIVFEGKISPEIAKAAQLAGLSIRERKVDSKTLTDIYLPDVTVKELEKAQAAFDQFANSYVAVTSAPLVGAISEGLAKKPIKMSVPDLIEAYQKTGRVAYQYKGGKKKGKISLNGFPAISEKEAVKRMQEVIQAETKPVNDDLEFLKRYANYAATSLEDINRAKNLLIQILGISSEQFDQLTGVEQRKLAQGAVMRMTEESVLTPVATPEGVQDTIQKLEETIIDDLLYGDEEKALIKLAVRDELVKSAQANGFNPVVTSIEILRQQALERQAVQEQAVKEAEKEVGPAKAEGVILNTNLLANHPSIQQFATTIRNAVLSWKKTKETNDIAGMIGKYPGLDEVAEAVREVINNSEANVDMKTLADILDKFPKGVFKGVLGRKEGTAKIIEEIPPPPKALPPIPEGEPREKMKGFLKSILESETAKRGLKEKIIKDIYLYYKQIGNPQVVEDAQKLIATDREGTLARVLKPDEPLDLILQAAGHLLINQIQYEGKFDLAGDIAEAVDEKARAAGRIVQINVIWNRLTPEGMLQFGYRTVKKALEKVSISEDIASKVLSELGAKRFPTKAEIEASRQIAKDTSTELTKVNREVVDEVVERVVTKVKERKVEGKKEKAADVLLAQRIRRYTKSLLADPDKENDPVMMMVQTLYKVAREVLPDQQQLPPNELEFVADAVQNRDKYKDIWEQAKEIVREAFADNEDALELLDEYFASYLDRPFSTKQLEKIVREGIKTEEETVGDTIAKIVKTYYLDKQKIFGETLAHRLMEEADLIDKDALFLEGYVIEEFKRLTSEKKESILKNMTKTVKKLEKKDFWQKTIELSNLGAFSDSRYFDIIANRLNIPNISSVKASKIFYLTQEMQKLQEGTPEHTAMRKKTMDLISEEIPLGVLDIFEAYRYSNLLSSPRTQMRNFFWDTLAGVLIVPTDLLSAANLDSIRYLLKGAKREDYYKSIPIYYKQYFNSLPLAWHQAMEAFRGNIIPDNPDLRDLKFARLRKEKPRLTWIPRLMEAADQFFLTTISSGLSAIYQSQGMDSQMADQMGLARAQEMLLRAKLDPKNTTGQGPVGQAFDKFSIAIGSLRSAAPPLQLVIPFIRVSTQFLKQSIIYGPGGAVLGVLPGTSREYSRLYQAKAFTGLMAIAAGGMLALRGDTTWEPPDDEEERTAFWDSGKRPYSIKIGNIWIPMIYFGTLFAPLAFSAALKYYDDESPTASSDSYLDKIFKATAGLGKAYMDLSFLSNLGNFFAALEGDANVPAASFWANLISQYSPMVGFTRYLSTIVDPTFRKTKTFWDAIKKNYPFLTKSLEPYYNIKGEESKRNISAILLPYDVGIHNPEAFYLWRQRQKQMQFNKVMNTLVKEIDVPEHLKKDDLKEMEYISTHPETTYVKVLNSLKSKLADLSVQEFNLYRDTVSSPEEKGTMLETIEQQRMEVMNQVNEVHQEILKLQGKEGPMLFDEVEAAEYAKDFIYFREGMQPEINKIQIQADNFYDKVKEQATLDKKYQQSREWFRMGVALGEKGIERAKSIAKQAGLDPVVAEYDFLTSLDVDQRKIYVYDQIENKSGEDLYEALVQMRKKSPGTGSMILTGPIIDELVDEGILTKSEAKVLKEIKLDIHGKPPAEVLKAAGTGKGKGGAKAKISVGEMPIFKPRIPKISTPKITAPKIKIKRIVSPKFKVKSVQTPSMSIPKLRLKQIRIPTNMRELMAI